MESSATSKVPVEPKRKSLEQVESCLNIWLNVKPGLEPVGENGSGDGGATNSGSSKDIGLLLDSSRKYSKQERKIGKILLCVDLHPYVLDEAVEKKVDLIIAYHSPITTGMGYLIDKCLSKGIWVYSAHSALDSINGGINDRVLKAVRTGINSFNYAYPITTPKVMEEPDVRGMVFYIPMKFLPEILEKVPFHEFPDVVPRVEFTPTEDYEKTVEEPADVRGGASLTVLQLLTLSLKPDPSEEKLSFLSIYGKKAQLQPVKESILAAGQSKITKTESLVREDFSRFGTGRTIPLTRAMSIGDAIAGLKEHMGLNDVRWGRAETRMEPSVKSIAVSVGHAGPALLQPLMGKHDLLITTGDSWPEELRDCLKAGSSLLLLNEWSTAQSYLSELAKIVKMVTGLEDVQVSEKEKHPCYLAQE